MCGIDAQNYQYTTHFLHEKIKKIPLNWKFRKQWGKDYLLTFTFHPLHELQIEEKPSFHLRNAVKNKIPGKIRESNRKARILYNEREKKWGIKGGQEIRSVMA